MPKPCSRGRRRRVRRVLALLALLAAGGGVLAVCGCLFVALLGIGGSFPACTALAQSLATDASGPRPLLGTSQFLLGALAAPLVGLRHLRRPAAGRDHAGRAGLRRRGLLGLARR
ncbi:hypothetical protein NKH77_44640 [Streptomyces sp. M19]